MPKTLNIDSSWNSFFSEELEKDYYKKIKEKLVLDINSWETIYPPLDLVFNAFSKTSLDNLKVVILWQDPYHGSKQAHWLSFSVQDWINPPPSLKNIFKELNADLWIEIPKSWNLEKWTKEGVMLLNAILTVIDSQPASHSKIWWEILTDNAIKYISDNKSWIVFILWWSFAKSKKSLIDLDKHFIIESAHPSPFSAHSWFFGSKPFSKCNAILEKLWKEKINWTL